MKHSLSPARISERNQERERRYPFYIAIDLTVYWILCIAIFSVCVILCAIVLYNNSPQFAAWAAPVMRYILR